MRPKLLRLAHLFTLAAVAFGQPACQKDNDDLTGDKNPLSDKVQELVSGNYEAYKAEYPAFPGGIAVRVIYPDDILFCQEGFSETISEDIHFRGQSTTKTFTAAGIALLYQEGLINFESRVTDMLPGKDIPCLPDNSFYNIPYKGEITIRQLLNHTAGVYDVVNNPDGADFVESMYVQNPDSTITLDVMTSFISNNQKSRSRPGELWSYSNSGYQLLAKILERASGKSYRQFMEDAFVKPLHLEHTSFPDTGTDQALPEPYVDSWVLLSGEILNLTAQNMSASVGEGNVITSPGDLSTFYKLLLNGEAGINASVVEDYMLDCVPLSAQSTNSYGMGLFHKEIGYGHDGDGSGISVRCYTDPSSDITVFAFTNAWNFNNGPDDMQLLVQQCAVLDKLMLDVKQLVLEHGGGKF